MAKPNKKLGTDDFSFDDDFAGLDDPFDSSPKKASKDRNPVLSATRSFGSGVKDSVLSESTVRKLVKKSLPRGYGDALDLVDQSTRSIRDLYNSSASDLKPVLNELKRTTGKILPVANPVLPKKLQSALKKFADSASDSDGGSKVDPREASIASGLAAVFGAQAEADIRRDQINDAQDKIKQSIDNDRFQKNFGQFDQMRQGVQALVQYQNKITINYQRKSLELQYRQYFLAQEMMEASKKQNALVADQLAGILKNTGLPEYSKLTTAERAKEAFRNRFLESMNDGIFDRRRNFIKDVTGRFVDTAKSRVKDFTNSVRAGLSQAEMIAESMAAAKEMGIEIDPVQMAAMLAGNSTGNAITDWVAKKASKAAGNSKYLQKYITPARKLGNKATFAKNNLSQIGKKWANSYDNETGAMAPAVRFLKDMISSLGGTDNSLQRDSLMSIQGPEMGSGTRHATKSLTEIMPGYLARILREIQILRTGNDSIELLTYDYNRNKFDSQSGVRKTAFSSLVKKSDKERTQEEVNSLLDELESKAGTKFTDQERKDYGQWMLKDNLRDGLASKKRLSDSSTYGRMGKSSGLKLSESFEAYFKGDDTGDLENRFAAKYGQLGSSISDARAIIQSMVNAGQEDILLDMGIIDPRFPGTINMERFQEFFFDGTYDPTVDAALPSKARSTRSARPGRIDRRRTRPSGPKPVNDASRVPRSGSYRDVGQLGNKRYEGHIFNVGTPSAYAGRPQQSAGSKDKCCEELIATLKENSSKELVQEIAQSLLRIEQRLEAGIATHGGEPGSGGTGALGGSWLDGSIRGNAKRLWGGIRNKATGLWGNAKAKYESVKNWFPGFKDQAMDKLRGYKERADVYVKGEVMPRLEAIKMAAGEYRDMATKKIISKLEDIVGPVIDKDGNIVLNAEDAKKAFIKSPLGAKMLSGIARIKDWGKTGFKFLRAGLGGIYGIGFDLAMKGWDLLKEKLDGPQDVYVRGQKEPVLTALIMRNGGYFSFNTKGAVTKVSEIDGPVTDASGNVLLTSDDIAMGLLDKNGQPLAVGKDRLMNMGRGLIQKGKAFLGKGLNFLKNLGKGVGLGGIGEWFTKMFSGEGGFFEGSKKQTDLLQMIYDLLNERMPGKKVSGDADGDGIRDGSVEDRRRKKKEKETAAAEKKDGGKDKQSAGLLGGLKGLIDRIRGKKKDEEEDKNDGDVNLDLGGNGDEKTDKKGKKKRPGRRPPRPPKPTTRWGKFKNLAGRAGRGVWNAGKWLGRGALTLGGSLIGSDALGAGLSLARGGLALGSAGVSATAGALGGLGAMAGSAMAGLGAILASPVVLGALAIGAVGAGLYFGYKYATRNSLTPMTKLRYAQYGFDPEDNSKASVVLGLEEKLSKGIIFNGEIADLDPKKIDSSGILGDFGIDPQDQKRVQAWTVWFLQRFKPVYLVHVSALNKAKKGTSLEDVDTDKLTPEEKKAYLNIAKWDSGPYDQKTSPFADIESLPADRAMVAKYADEALKAAAKGPEKSGRAASLGIGGAKAPAPNAALATPQPKGRGGDAGSGIIKPATLGTTMAAATAAAPTTKLTGTATPIGDIYSNTLDALTAIRFKAYGLNEMDQEKVRSLAYLEAEVQKQIKYNSSKVAEWNGTPEDVLGKLGGSFGIEGTSNRNASNWIAWFTGRFMPVYLNFATLTFGATGKEDPVMGYTRASSQQVLEIALGVAGTSTTVGNRSGSIWSINVSPWLGYSLNTDATSVKANIQGLKDEAKNSTLGEQKANTREDTEAEKDKLAKIGAGEGSVKNPANASFADKILNKIGSSYDFAKKTAGDAWNTVSDTMKTGVNAVSNAMGLGAPMAVGGGDMSGGYAMSAPTTGTGGMMDKVPMPTGSGKYAYVKDTLDAAARIVGMDPKLMAAIAAQESAFRVNAKADTSSASGLFQFTAPTWAGEMKKYGAKFGIPPGTSPMDPRANALLGAQFLKDNAEALMKIKKGPITDSDLYLAHFMGKGGASQFLRADPNSNAASIFPKQAKANKSIFFENSDPNKPRTIAGVYQVLGNSIKKRARQLGLNLDGNPGGEAIVPSKSGQPGATPGAAAGPGKGTVAPVVQQTPATTGKKGTAPAPAKAQAPAATKSAAPEFPIASQGSGLNAVSFAPTPSMDNGAPISGPTSPQSNKQPTVSTTDMSGVESRLDDQTAVLKAILEVAKAIASRRSDSGSKGKEAPAALVPMTKKYQ